MTEAVEQTIFVRDTKITPHTYAPPSPRSSSSPTASMFLMIVVFGVIVFGIVAFCLSSISLASLLPHHSSLATPPSIPPSAAAATTTATATPNKTHSEHIHYHHKHTPKSTLLEPVSFQVRELQGTIMIEQAQPQIHPSSDSFDISQVTTDGPGYGATADMQQLQQQATQYRNMYPENNNMPIEYRYQNPNYAPQQAIDPNPVYGVFGPQPPPAAPRQAQPQQAPQPQPFQQALQQQQQQTQPMTRPQMIQPQPLPPARTQAQPQFIPVTRVAPFPQTQPQPSNNIGPFPSPPSFQPFFLN